MSADEGVSVGRPLRVLLLAERLDALRPDVPLPARLEAKVFAASGEDTAGRKLPWQVRRVRAGEVRPREAARVPVAWAQTQWVARRAGLPPSWLWTIKRDRWLRRQLGAADVVVSMDEATDGVLRLVPDLLERATVLEYADRQSHQQALAVLVDLLGRLRALTTDSTEQAWLDRAERTALARLMERVVDAGLPGILVPVDDVADVGRRLAPALGQRESADVILNVLGLLDWDAIPDAGTSGVLAQQAIARLWLREGADLPGDDQLARAAQAALTGSDQALDAGAGGLARTRLADAMGVLFHRERHAESLSTPLVPEPAELLAPLWANRTLRKLVSGGDRPRLSPEPSGGRLAPEPSDADRPRVLAIPGVYGDFHQPVIDALQQVADVETSDVRMRFLSRRLLDPAVLDALAVLRGWGPGHGERDPHRVLAVHRLVTEALGPALQRAQVVFTDWADRATVWASHLVPAQTRFVVRIHSLDAFDPWFHLVDWSAVDHAIVVSEPLRVLVERLLALAGAQVPVTVLPNLAALQAVDLPKEPGARTTLGLVGWGRRVKDPLCALELLAREPSWRLRLIGPDLVPAVSEGGQSYNRQVRALLDDPAIAERVHITGWTDDVASELRHVGVILSTSRRESWHLGLVEGAASGAVPVVRDWPAIAPLGGARALFPDEWVVSDLDEAEARIRAVTQPDTWDDARHRAQREARERFDPEAAAQHYREVILGPHLPGA